MSELRTSIRKFSLNEKIEQCCESKVTDYILPFLTLGGFLAAKQITKKYLSLKVKSFSDDAGLTKNDKNEKYALCFGYAVKRHTENEYTKKGIYATQVDARMSNIISPILLNDDILRQHVQVIGTTGSGKTQLLKGLLEQQIARGGGAFAVFGKADNVMLQQMYAVAVEYGREQDFFVVDWTATKEQVEDSVKLNGKSILTNSINMFELGSVENVVNSLIKVAGLNNGGDKWESAAKDYLSAVVRLLSTLKDSDLIFNIDKIDTILESDSPLDSIRKYKEELSFYTLFEIITSIEKTFKLVALFEKIYEIDRIGFEEMLYEKGMNGNIEFDERINSRDDIQNELKKVLEQQINGISINAIMYAIHENTFSNLPITDKTFYKLEISQSQLGNLITFYNKFALVLKNKKSDFNFLEAFRSGKIVIFNIPGQESEDAKIIGKMVMAILNLLVKKQGKAPQSKQTFLGIFDEINSWAKGDNENVFGLGDILSVVRGLGISGIIAHQSSLDSMGKGTSEKEQIQANINTKIILKTESSDILKELNELVGKKEEKYRKDKIKNEDSRSDDDVEILEKDYFTKKELGSLWAGQGYLIRNRVVAPMITYYLPNKRYSVLDEDTIPITKTIDFDDLKKMI